MFEKDKNSDRIKMWMKNPNLFSRYKSRLKCMIKSIQVGIDIPT